MLDLRIVDAVIIDGTGAEPTPGTVAVRDGRIVPDDGSEANTTIDVGGQVVAPGLIDIHTHYDAQVFWDPFLTPSPLHGVTTVMSGNCGFSLAPGNDEDLQYLVTMLSRVEGMPIDALQAGVPLDWNDFGQFLDAVERRGVAVNMGFLTGHSAVRRHAMGKRSVGEKANGDDIAAMQQILSDCLRDGSFGFSTSFAAAHTDANLDPVPSRWADDDEFVALSAVLRDHPGTQLENAPEVGPFEPHIVERMSKMSVAAGRPINWNLLTVGIYEPELYANQLAASDYARERGGCIKGLVKPYPSDMYLSFETGAIIEIISDDWHQLFKLPVPQRMEALRDPEWRKRLNVSGGRFEKFSRWADYTVRDVFSATNEPLRDRKIGDIAREWGRTPFETILDVVLADDLRTDVQGPHDDGGELSWNARVELCRDQRLIVGGSDAGGHLDTICGSVLTTRTLREYIDRKLMPLEEMIKQMTDIPARFLGLKGRGRLALGYAADMFVFDPATVDAKPLTRIHDLPAGADRLFGGSVGVSHVLVNGRQIVADGQLVEANAASGKVLRSGRDSTTVDNDLGFRIGGADDR